MSVQITFHGMESNGVDSLTGKDGEVLIVTFEDGTISQGALSAKSLLQLLKMKFSQAKTAGPKPQEAKPEVKPLVPVAMPANGAAK